MFFFKLSAEILLRSLNSTIESIERKYGKVDPKFQDLIDNLQRIIDDETFLHSTTLNT